MTNISDTGGMVRGEIPRHGPSFPVETPPVSEPPPLEVGDLVKAADHHVHSLGIAINELTNACGEILDPLLLAGYLADLRDHIQDARRAYDEIERFFLSEAGEKSYDVPNLGRVEVKSSKRRTRWQHDDLFRHVLARIADDRAVFWDVDDGTFLPSSEVAARIVDRLREVLSPTWKVGGLKALGLSPGEFCDEDEAHHSVQLPSRRAV